MGTGEVVETSIDHTTVAPKFEALFATLFEADARLAPVRVDVTSVWLVRSTVKYTHTRCSHLEGHVPEVPGFELVQDVGAV